MATVFLLITALYTAATVASPSGKYPYPFENGISPCDDQPPPPIVSFHIHAVFDGTNRTIAKAALQLRDAFIMFANPQMELCPFSHSDSAHNYTDVCYFPYNASMAAFPFPMSPIFGASDFAFFIPNDHLLTIDIWWRQHYNPELISFMIHPNTGCEDNSHTIWAMVNENYPWKTDDADFFCCHDGPDGCYCDLVQYVLNDNSTNDHNLCVTANYTDYSMSLKYCGDSTDGKYDNTNFVETHYSDSFIQLENFGPTDGYTRTDTYMCLGQQNGANLCNKGNRIKLMDCYQNDDRLNLFNFVDGKIKALGCTNEDLCVNYHPQSGYFVLDECVKSATFQRAWYNPMP